MFGNERGLQTLYQTCQPLEVRAADPLGAAEREAYAVDRQRIAGAQPLERPHGRSAAHVIFGMDFEPSDGRPALQNFRHMRRAQADAAAARVHGILWTRDVRPAMR